MGSVTPTAMRLLEDAVKKSGRRSTVQLPEEFARTPGRTDADPMLADLFRRGELQLKLYLTLVMLTRKGPPHELFRMRPDHYFSEMLGYDELDDADPVPGPGTRRVRRAMAQLHSGGYIVRTAQRGRSPNIEVVHPPGSTTAAPYITLPLELWSQGWIIVLSARALFVYTCLRLMLAGKPDDQGAHVTTWDRRRMHVKDDTWQRGVKELELKNLVRTDKRRVVVDRWTTDLSLQKVYFLNNDYLKNNEVTIST